MQLNVTRSVAMAFSSKVKYQRSKEWKQKSAVVIPTNGCEWVIFLCLNGLSATLTLFMSSFSWATPAHINKTKVQSLTYCCID